MHKTMISAAAGLALLITVLLSWDANATTLTGVGTFPSSTQDVAPVQTVACWCGPLGGSTAALRGGPSYRCSCHRARALRGRTRVPCSALGTEFYCKANQCHWQRWSMTCM
jgi:hypothetical protein